MNSYPNGCRCSLKHYILVVNNTNAQKSMQLLFSMYKKMVNTDVYFAGVTENKIILVILILNLFSML